jgi:hypothetical protein
MYALAYRRTGYTRQSVAFRCGYFVDKALLLLEPTNQNEMVALGCSLSLRYIFLLWWFRHNTEHTRTAVCNIEAHAVHMALCPIGHDNVHGNTALYRIAKLCIV